MIKHFTLIKEKQVFYLCNQACGTTKEKLTNDYFKVTCKNCKKILDKDKKLWEHSLNAKKTEDKK